MPDKATIQRVRRDVKEGKSPSTQAGEFVREEIHHIRAGKHGARSAKQAIAIGLSKARKAGVPLPPAPGAKPAGHARVKRAPSNETSATRARVALGVLKKAPKAAASHAALARQARQSAAKRGPGSLHAAAMKAVVTKGPSGLRIAARKAAATRQKGH